MYKKFFSLISFVLVLGFCLALMAQTATADDQMAGVPKPPDKMTDVPADVILSWTPGVSAVKHDVYLGTNLAAVQAATRTDPRGVLVSQDLVSNMYDPGKRLKYSQVYYWRIDEVGSSIKGDVWSFTVEPIGYPVPGGKIKAVASSTRPVDGPLETINSAGLDDNDLHSTNTDHMWLSDHCTQGEAWIQYEFDQVYKLSQMWVWNYNSRHETLLCWGIKDATLEFSTDGKNWTGAKKVVFNKAPAANGYVHNTEVNLHIAAKYVKITANSNHSKWNIEDVYGLSEVRFLYSPVWPREPDPASGATGLDPQVVLSWRAGREASTHALYLDKNQQAVINRTAPVVNPPDASYGPGFTLGQTYYWRVDEVNNAEVPTLWPGEVWNFSIVDSLLVDDMENSPEAVWMPAGGATVAVSSDSVHHGSKALALNYNNTLAPYSEITADVTKLAIGGDWTIGKPTTLVLYFFGDLSNTLEQMYARIGVTCGVRYCTLMVPYNGNANKIATPFWTQWNIDITPLGADLNAITDITIGIGNPNNAATGGSGVVYLDDLRLYYAAPAMAKAEIWVEAEAFDMITSPMEVYYNTTASGGLSIGTDDGVGNQDNNPPAPAGTASYKFTVAGGTYKVMLRVSIAAGNDLFWVRIPGATTQTNDHSSGWVRMNGIKQGEAWHWAEVFSSDDSGNPTVLFTMPAGTYTLNVAYGKDGAKLDAIVITDRLD